MCGRFASDWDAATIAAKFGAELSADLPRRSWNVSPGGNIAILLEGNDGKRRLTPAHWSLIPPWSPTKTLKYPTFNARIESALEKPTFRDSALRMHAIIPASGYYEWKGKRPYFFSKPVPNKPAETLWLCGLYSWWRASGTSPWELTATILTRDAVGPLASIHDRMPVMIPDSMVPDWLSKQVSSSDIFPAASSATEEEAATLKFHEVKPLRGDGHELIERKGLSEEAATTPGDDGGSEDPGNPISLLRQ